MPTNQLGVAKRLDHRKQQHLSILFLFSIFFGKSSFKGLLLRVGILLYNITRLVTVNTLDFESILSCVTVVSFASS